MRVEVDETHLFKRKYKKGRYLTLEDWWLFGAICKETGQFFSMAVPDRKKETLWPIMASRIAAESIVYTDSAAVYQGVGRELGLNWVHMTVNHSNKKAPYVRYVWYKGHVYCVHTNQVERLWRHIKAFIRSPQSYCDLDIQISWSIYVRVYFKDLPTNMRFKKFLEAATGQLPGPVEEPEAPDDGERPNDLTLKELGELSDSEPDSDELLLIVCIVSSSLLFFTGGGWVGGESADHLHVVLSGKITYGYG